MSRHEPTQKQPLPVHRADDLHPVFARHVGWTGAYYAEMRLVEMPQQRDRRLLLAVAGADFDRYNDEKWPTFLLEACADHRDDDDSVTRIALAHIGNPSITRAYSGRLTYQGTLIDAAWYRTGDDPEKRRAREDDTFCRYAPPRRADVTGLVPNVVTVDLYPIDWFDTSDESVDAWLAGQRADEDVA